MAATDLALLDLGTLQALCIERGLSLCTTPEPAVLVAYLESNLIGCPVNVGSDVMLTFESKTACSLLLVVTVRSQSAVLRHSTSPLQNEAGTLLAPNRVKIFVEIKNFPFTVTRPRLALKVAYAGAAPHVAMSVIGNGLDLSDFDLSLLDLPDLPSLPDLLSLPNGSSSGDKNGSDWDIPDWLPKVPALPGLPDWLPWGKHSASSEDAGQASHLVMSQTNSIEINRDGKPGAASVYAAAAAAAAAKSLAFVALSRKRFGGDIVTGLLANGSLSQIPSALFAFAAYSTWDEHVIDAVGNRRSVTTSALGTAHLDVGAFGGLAALFLAGVNASVSEQFVSERAVLQDGGAFEAWLKSSTGLVCMVAVAVAVAACSLLLMLRVRRRSSAAAACMLDKESVGHQPSPRLRGIPVQVEPAELGAAATRL
ncbi:hypothetical protein T492DRAFT_1122253 [Pavlovales sp. CCMP2436]|nr:hypothetical protein T492DRAFT_1122253 [Pavlovales sp. CCMP2436]